jgi:hypothetical protein
MNPPAGSLTFASLTDALPAFTAVLARSFERQP